MKSKFTTFIISIVIILIIIVIILFGIIFFSEIQNSIEPDAFQTIGSTVSTINENIETPKIIESQMDNISDETEINVDYSNVTVNKYFYNQLNDYEKTIYKALESNKDNMKTGTYKVQLGTSFTEILNKENGQDILGEYYQSAIESYNYDNPDTFYLNPSKMYLNMETIKKGKNTTYNVFIDNGEEENYLVDEFSSKVEIDQAVNQLEQIRNSAIESRSGNIYKDIKMVHDYLIKKIDYDTTISKPNIYNIYGALINKESVCEGYAKSFKYLMDGLGIPCTLVIGQATNSTGKTENHAWNYVQISGNWYAIDCTWDDPVIEGGFATESYKYKYFLKGAQSISKDHFPSHQFTEGGKEYSYPSISNVDYE